MSKLALGKPAIGLAALIWDSDGLPPCGENITLLWRSYDNGGRDNVISIPKLVEANSDVYRSKYLAWIYDLGQEQINGSRIIDHLEIHEGFSFWWMTLLNEKSNYFKSPQIEIGIKLFAFLEWAQEAKIVDITLVSAENELAEILKLWAHDLGLAFKWRQLKKPQVSLSWQRRIYEKCPYVIKALTWLPRYVIKRWHLRGVGLREWQQSKGYATFFSYLFNLLPEAVINGRYESRYWAHLPDVLLQEDFKTNWLHLYVEDELLPSSRQAAETLRRFNKAEKGKQIHVALDSFLSFSIVIRTIRDWIHLVWIGVKLRKRIRISAKKQCPLNLWPLFEDDWRQSMFGITAISNLLYLNLFESALTSLPKQRVGVYLQENMSWEFGLIFAWRECQHGKIIGCPHSTIRYWDLRYYFDLRVYNQTKTPLSMPLPNLVAVNGSAAKHAYFSAGYPNGNIVEVEALRYLHLINPREHEDMVSTRQGYRLLILGDYTKYHTEVQMQMLTSLATRLPDNIMITLKSHPAFPIDPLDYPSLSFTVSNKPINELLQHNDVVYTSAVTSASVDAYCAGLPVITVLDPLLLNQSPLRGFADVFFVSSPENLLLALKSVSLAPKSHSNQQKFFSLDLGLPRWRKLILDSIQ
jgi:surface carbohydrate biosynthesis protein (TIGR04326 family)